MSKRKIESLNLAVTTDTATDISIIQAKRMAKSSRLRHAEFQSGHFAETYIMEIHDYSGEHAHRRDMEVFIQDSHKHAAFFSALKAHVPEAFGSLRHINVVLQQLRGQVKITAETQTLKQHLGEEGEEILKALPDSFRGLQMPFYETALVIRKSSLLHCTYGSLEDKHWIFRYHLSKSGKDPQEDMQKHTQPPPPHRLRDMTERARRLEMTKLPEASILWPFCIELSPFMISADFSREFTSQGIIIIPLAHAAIQPFTQEIEKYYTTLMQERDARVLPGLFGFYCPTLLKLVQSLQIVISNVLQFSVYVDASTILCGDCSGRDPN